MIPIWISLNKQNPCLTIAFPTEKNSLNRLLMQLLLTTLDSLCSCFMANSRSSWHEPSFNSTFEQCLEQQSLCLQMLGIIERLIHPLSPVHPSPHPQCCNMGIVSFLAWGSEVYPIILWQLYFAISFILYLFGSLMILQRQISKICNKTQTGILLVETDE